MAASGDAARGGWTAAVRDYNAAFQARLVADPAFRRAVYEHEAEREADEYGAYCREHPDYAELARRVDDDLAAGRPVAEEDFDRIGKVLDLVRERAEKKYVLWLNRKLRSQSQRDGTRELRAVTRTLRVSTRRLLCRRRAPRVRRARGRAACRRGNVRRQPQKARAPGDPDPESDDDLGDLRAGGGA